MCICLLTTFSLKTWHIVAEMKSNFPSLRSFLQGSTDTLKAIIKHYKLMQQLLLYAAKFLLRKQKKSHKCFPIWWKKCMSSDQKEKQNVGSTVSYRTVSLLIRQQLSLPAVSCYYYSIMAWTGRNSLSVRCVKVSWFMSAKPVLINTNCNYTPKEELRNTLITVDFFKKTNKKTLFLDRRTYSYNSLPGKQ